MGMCQSLRFRIKIINEKYLGGHPPPLTLPQTEYIQKQMKTGCVFLIQIKDKEFGTGFFCYIPFPNNMKLLPVLITNNHVLNKNNIEIGKILQIVVNNHNYKLIIDENRRTYTNEEYDTTIIEIRENDVFYSNDKFFNKSMI